MVVAEHAVSLVCIVCSSAALAQPYPSRPVRFIIPTAPGGYPSKPVRVVLPAAAGIRTIQELVTTAKNTSGGVNYTSPLIGSAAHLTVELFRTTAGIPLNRVVYKDSSPI